MKHKELYFVTTNKHKVDEIGTILKDYGIKLKHKNLEVQEPDYKTIEEVAIHKAKDAYRLVKKPLIVEDTGIFLNAYKNFPGIYSKRVWKAIGFDGFFRLLKGKTRKAYFKVVIVFISSPNNYKVFNGKLKGRLGKRVIGKVANRLPYEKIFIPEFEKRPIVKMTKEEKNRMSHRGIAARKLGRWLCRKK